ncbi:unnamed protein product, partial [Mesorhabditis spiculigera]
MAEGGFYRGTNADQDIRFTDKEKKLLKTMKFEDALEQTIDRAKVNLDVIKPWVTTRVTELLGLEDDVIIEYIITQLEEAELNPKVMQINITGFLNARRAREFMGELWSLLLEAQEAEDGIPPSLVEKKLKEVRTSRDNHHDRAPKRDNIAVEAAESDWKHRYTSLSGGNYAGPMIKSEKDDRIYHQQGREREPEPEQERDRERREEASKREEAQRRDKERDDREAARREETARREKERAERHREREREERRVKDGRRDRDRADSRRDRDRRDDRKDRDENRRHDRTRDDDRRESRKRRSRSRSPRRKFREASVEKEKKPAKIDSDDDDEDKKKHSKKSKKKAHKRSPSASSEE